MQHFRGKSASESTVFSLCLVWGLPQQRWSVWLLSSWSVSISNKQVIQCYAIREEGLLKRSVYKTITEVGGQMRWSVYLDIENAAGNLFYIHGTIRLPWSHQIEKWKKPWSDTALVTRTGSKPVYCITVCSLSSVGSGISCPWSYPLIP